jgi:predicted AAA+ superfamily ATPase
MLNEAEIRKIIFEQRDDIERTLTKGNVIERESTEHVCNYIESGLALINTGIRRCGKSTFSILLVKDRHFGYVNFDDERLLGLEASNLNSVLEAISLVYKDPEYIILDEIQDIFGWELFVNRLLRSKKVIVTGSSARLMSAELATHLTGRHIDFVLHPFSFREYLDYFKVEIDPNLTRSVSVAKRNLLEYIEKGGLPEGIKAGKLFHSALVSDIIRKDIVVRYNVRYVRELTDLVHLMISNISREFSYNRLTSAIGLKNVHTVKKYMTYIENSYLLFEVQRFSYKLKEQQKAPRKIYCMDTGIVSSLAFSTSRNFGYMMENLVAIELRRRASLDPDMTFFYWKDHRLREVDFVILRDRTVEQLIQVSYDEGGLDIRDRELSSLEAASKELGCDNMLIITFDKEEDRGNAITIPLWKWLLYP